MSLIARIQYVNFLTYSNPDSKDRKPAMRVVEFSPLQYSTAINIPNGHGKTNMITALLYLLSRDRKLKEAALPLFTPRRCGSPSHIRVQLWDLQDDLMQNDLGLDQGLIDPRDLPNNKDHYVFGLCAYQNEEPKFYHYVGTLEDCEVFDRTENGYLYHTEAEVQESIKAIKGKWNVASGDEWRSFITSHIPSRVLAQQVKFHLAGGGDKSAQLHQIEMDDDENFGQAFFRAVIAPELLAPNSDADNDPGEPRENFEELLYAHFSAMASATVKAEQERQIITEQEDAVKVLGGLVDAGKKAKQGHDEYQGLIAAIARDGAVVKHLVQTDPLPGLLDGRNMPSGRVGEIVPYIVIDKLYGAMILDAGLEKLANVDTSNLNRAAERKHIQKYEIDQSQVIDFAWNHKISGDAGWGGARATRKAYVLDAAIQLLPLLKEIGNAKIAGAEDVLKQAFAWIESVGDTNAYRKEVRQLMAEITRLESVIKGRETEITQWEKEARELVEIITKYDLAKGAYEDIVKSGKFTADELDAPARLTAKVTQELREVESALETHNKRVGKLEETFTSYMQFCQNNPGITARARLEELTVKNSTANDVLHDAELRLKHATEELQRLAGLKISQEEQNRGDQKQLDSLLDLQSHEATYTEWFGEADPCAITISENLRKIATDEALLAQRRNECESLQNVITELLPSIPHFQQLFGDEDAKQIDISGELKKIATMEQSLSREQNTAEVLHGKLLQLKPFVKTFHEVFGNTDPAQLDPTKKHSELQQAIASATSTVEVLEAQVDKLKAFRAAYPGITAAEWLNNMEAQRSSLTREIAQSDQQIQTAERQLAELMNDPVARPEEIVSAHALIDGVVPFTTLHNFIKEHCPSAVKQHWLTHFSALLFSPVVNTPDEAAKAAHLLYDGQAMIPVLIANRLKSMMASETPTMALADGCAYTWLAGVKTRMVHCLLNPEAVEGERELARARLDEFIGEREGKQEALNQLSDKTEAVTLAREAARTENANAETTLASNVQMLAELREQLPEIEKRSSNESLESILRVREYKTLLNKHGDDVFNQLALELSLIEEKINALRESRSWYEERNTDEVRDVIAAMRRYQDLLLKHGNDVHQNVLNDLKQIAEEGCDLQRSREWNEARNTDDVRSAIDAMRRYNIAGGAAEVVRLRSVVETGIAALDSILVKLSTASDAISQAETYVATSRFSASDAATAYNQNKKYLADIVSFAESDDLPFMEDHQGHRNILDLQKGKADIRKSYESQFAHAQRYRDEEGSNTSEQALVDRKAILEQKVEASKQAQEYDTEAIVSKRGRCTALTPFRDNLHEAAAHVLGEFRAVSKSLDEIGAAMNSGASRFENTDLYQLAESIRPNLERIDSDPFFIAEIRKIGRLASELGLAAQSKEIARAKRDSGQLYSRYKERKATFCSEIIGGTIKGLSALNAEWLQSEDRFEAPLEMKTQIEVNIESKREMLQKATTTLEDVRDKTTRILSDLAKDSQRALSILEEAMCTTHKARFFVLANVISSERVNELMTRLYSEIEARRRSHSDGGLIAAQKRKKKSDLEYLRGEIYRSLFADVSVEFCHPSIWAGERSLLTAKGLSEGMRTAVSLMWIAKLAEFRLRQSIDSSGGGGKRQNRAALRKERYFMILDGLFSNLSHDDMIDSAMESLRLSAGHFQLIGMIHHPRYINNPKIFRSYFVGRPYRSGNGKHAWLTVDQQNNVPDSLGVFGSYLTQQDNRDEPKQP